MYSISFKAYKHKDLIKIHRMINTSAWIWNHCVALQKRYYKLTGKYINVNKLQKHIAKLRKRNKKWSLLNSQSVQEICQRLDASYNRFFKKIAKRPPKFKKSVNFNSFVLKQAGWSITGNMLVINKIGMFKFSKSRNYENIKRISVKRNKLGEIFFVLWCDLKPIKYERVDNSIIGMDFGLKTYLTLNNGTEIQSPQFFKQYQDKIAKANKDFSRKKKGSKNRKKSLKRLQMIHIDVKNKRSDFHWKLAHELCKNNSIICIEDLNIDGMKKLWGKKITDLSFSEFVNRLEQIAVKYGTHIQKIGKFFPSSKMCSCGIINKELTLKDRVWTCKSCNTTHERDILAANNIKAEGIRLYRTKCKTSIVEAA